MMISQDLIKWLGVTPDSDSCLHVGSQPQCDFEAVLISEWCDMCDTVCDMCDTMCDICDTMCHTTPSLPLDVSTQG